MTSKQGELSEHWANLQQVMNLVNTMQGVLKTPALAINKARYARKNANLFLRELKILEDLIREDIRNLEKLKTSWRKSHGTLP